MVSDTTMTAVAPDIKQGWGHWRVTTPGGTANSGPFYLVNPPPKITSVHPNPAKPGTGITIRGSGFTDTTSVTFAWQPMSAYTIVSSTKITATVPHQKGWGHWRVTTPRNRRRRPVPRHLTERASGGSSVASPAGSGEDLSLSPRRPRGGRVRLVPDALRPSRLTLDVVRVEPSGDV